MTLEQWLKKNNITVYRMSKDTGINEGYLNRVVRGMLRPLKHAPVISRYTEGQVTVAELLGYK